MLKYQILVRILDKICEEAPGNFKSYHPDKSDFEKMQQARAKAYIHLFLKVKCGVASFGDRHALITDGNQDGGVDAYFIDREKKNSPFGYFQLVSANSVLGTNRAKRSTGSDIRSRICSCKSERDESW